MHRLPFVPATRRPALFSILLFLAISCADEMNAPATQSDGARMLTHGASDSMPSWSPSGTAIAFVAPAPEDTTNLELWWVRFAFWPPAEDDIVLPSRITRNDARDAWPRWAAASDDGILFASDRSGTEDIYVVDPMGSFTEVWIDGPAEDTEPCWGPTADRITFCSDRDGNREVYVYFREIDECVRVTDDPANDTGPAWCPVDDRIAFVSDREGNEDIWISSWSGARLRRLTEDPAADTQPCWSPDGTRLAFTSNRSGNDDIWILDVDGGALVRLTDSESDDRNPAWSQSGDRIAFSSNRGPTGREPGPWNIWAIDVE